MPTLEQRLSELLADSGKKLDLTLAVIRGATLRLKAADPVTNAPPVVDITSPIQGQSFAGPASITITASVSDATLARVEFYRDLTLIDGTDTTVSGTKTYTDSGVASQTTPYVYRVRAIDRQGLTTDDVVSVNVTTPILGSVNIAAARYGSVPFASTSANVPGFFTLQGVNDETTTLGWANGAPPTYPSYAGVAFQVSQAIQRFVLTNNTISDGRIESRSGGVWTAVPGGTVSSTADVVAIQATAVNCDAFRVLINTRPPTDDGHCHLRELQAWTAGSPAPSDPVLRVSSPFANSTFAAPATVQISVSAASVEAVTLQAYRDTTLLATSTTGSLLYTDAAVAAGAYQYKFVATGASGRVSQQIVTVTVQQTVSVGFFEARAALPQVIRALPLEANSPTDAALDGRWPYDNVGVWTGTSENPVIDTAFAPIGRKASVRTRFPSISDANYCGGMFINSRGGQQMQFNPSSIPNYDDLSFALQGRALIGKKFAVQVLVMGDTNYCFEPIWKEDQFTFETRVGVPSGHKILDVTAPNFGQGNSINNPTTSHHSKVVITGFDQPTGCMYPNMYRRNGGNNDDGIIAVRGPEYQTDFQPRTPNNYTPYAEYTELVNHPGKSYTGSTTFKGGVHLDPNKFHQVQGVWELKDILSGPDFGFGQQDPTWTCLINHKLYWGRPGKREELVIDYDAVTFQGQHFLNKTSLFNFITGKARFQVHQEMRFYFSSCILGSDKIPSAAEVEFEWNPTYRVGNTVDQWHPFPNSTMAAYSFNGPPYEPWNTNNATAVWNAGITDAWGAMQHDSLRGKIVSSVCGGHAESRTAKNGIQWYEYATQTPGWKHIKASSPYTFASDLNGAPARAHYPDGGPASQHCFNGTAIVEMAAGPRIVATANYAATQQGDPEVGPNGAGIYNNACQIIIAADGSATAAWHPFATGRQGLATPGAPTWNVENAIDIPYPGTKRLYAVDGHSPFGTQIWYWLEDENIAAGTWHLVTGQPLAITHDPRDFGAFIDHDLDRMVMCGASIGGGTAKVLVVVNNLKNGTPSWQVITLSGDTSGIGPVKLNTGVYDSVRKRYLIADANDGNAALNNLPYWLSAVDPVTGFTTKLAVLPETQQTDDGSVGRTLHYSQGLRAAIYWPRFDRPGYYFTSV